MTQHWNDAAPLRCRPGDLAIVVRGINAGALVEVIARGFDEDIDEPAWDCKCLQRIAAYHPDLERDIEVGPGDMVIVADSMLRPLRGGEQYETVRDAEVEVV